MGKRNLATAGALDPTLCASWRRCFLPAFVGLSGSNQLPKYHRLCAIAREIYGEKN